MHPEKIIGEAERLRIGENPVVHRCCAWCEAQSGNQAARLRGRLVTHGICQRHARELLAGVGLEVVKEGEFNVVREIQHQLTK
jgi:hypothetical protein